MITGYYWILLTANPVRYADIRPCNGFAGETFLFESAIARGPKEQREQSQACLSYAESRLWKTMSIFLKDS